MGSLLGALGRGYGGDCDKRQCLPITFIQLWNLFLFCFEIILFTNHRQSHPGLKLCLIWSNLTNKQMFSQILPILRVWHLMRLNLDVVACWVNFSVKLLLPFRGLIEFSCQLVRWHSNRNILSRGENKNLIVLVGFLSYTLSVLNVLKTSTNENFRFKAGREFELKSWKLSH